MKELIVKSQAKLDSIPLSFDGEIIINFGSKVKPAVVRNRYIYPVEIWKNSFVEMLGYSNVVAYGNSSVKAWDNSNVVACDNSYVVACDNSYVKAWDNSSVVAWDNSNVVAYGNSSVKAEDTSSIEAQGNSSVEAWGNSSVVSWNNSFVEARDTSSIEARDNSFVEAHDSSSVVARHNSSVETHGSSSVETHGNSSVEAWDSSSVVAWGNSQIVDRTIDSNIKINGNARIVYIPKSINEFMDFHGIKYTKTKAIFYKAVKKVGDKYLSYYNNSFEYVIGETKTEYCDPTTDIDCGSGIHISHLQWALDFGRDWNDLAILEVETNIEDIVLPKNSDGKVRTSKIKVLREVPLEECGIYGKILADRKRAKQCVEENTKTQGGKK